MQEIRGGKILMEIQILEAFLMRGVQNSMPSVAFSIEVNMVCLQTALNQDIAQFQINFFDVDSSNFDDWLI